MHAYLIISGTPNAYLQTLANNLGAKKIIHEFSKIADARNLNSHTRLTLSEPILIVLENVDLATTEALNAFLKNLEEPQKNLYFALTAKNIRNVLPTIVSRCQVIVLNNQTPKPVSLNAERFLGSDINDRFLQITKIKDRETALKLVEDYIHSVHASIHSSHDYMINAHRSEIAIQTLAALKANAQVGLALTNMVVNLD